MYAVTFQDVGMSCFDNRAWLLDPYMLIINACCLRMANLPADLTCGQAL